MFIVALNSSAQKMDRFSFAEISRNNLQDARWLLCHQLVYA